MRQPRPIPANDRAHDDPISPIEDVIEDAREGRPYILVDAEDRENEGDVIIPAQMATPEQIMEAVELAAARGSAAEPAPHPRAVATDVASIPDAEVAPQ